MTVWHIAQRECLSYVAGVATRMVPQEQVNSRRLGGWAGRSASTANASTVSALGSLRTEGRAAVVLDVEGTGISGAGFAWGSDGGVGSAGRPSRLNRRVGSRRRFNRAMGSLRRSPARLSPNSGP